MLEHAKKLTESANDAFHQETDEADTQNISTQAAETGLDVVLHAKAAVHRLYATQADARRAVKQTDVSDLPGASPVLGNSTRFLRMSLLIRRRSIVNPRLPAKKSSSRAATFPTRRRRKAPAIPNPKPSRRKPSAASTCRRRTGGRFRRMCLFRVRRKKPSKPALPAFKSRCRLPEKGEMSLHLSSLPRYSAMPSTR